MEPSEAPWGKHICIRYEELGNSLDAYNTWRYYSSNFGMGDVVKGGPLVAALSQRL